MQIFSDTFGWVQLALFTGLLLLLTWPTGVYLFQVLDGSGKTFLAPLLRPVERTLYFLMRVDPQNEQDWKQYTVSMLAVQSGGRPFHLCDSAAAAPAAAQPAGLRGRSATTWPSTPR